MNNHDQNNDWEVAIAIHINIGPYIIFENSYLQSKLEKEKTTC